jgi:large subunit ribosomal protein L18
MKKKLKKLYLQKKRRALKRIVGTSERPRLSIFRSHKHIYAQIIDDQKGQTLASSSTVDKLLKEKLNNKTATQDAAFLIGETLAEKAIQKNITKIIFDRGDRPYHGRIKKVAEGARNSGLIF